MNQQMSAQAPPEQRRGKKAKVAGAAALAAILALSSTFAWTSFSQDATNEFYGEANAGGRLHDDFSFTQAKQNKDIYVENFTDPDNGGAPIFARVQLKEYLEIGSRAGQPETADKSSVVRTPEAATLDDASAWSVHYYDGTDTTFHDNFKWTTGGSTTFMPTFNKNKDSLEADINGSFRDPDGPYTLYKEYTDGQTLEGTAIYDADDNAIDEEDGAVEGVNIESKTETHTAKATGTASVMSMADWIAAGSQPGPYWVYDTDGWAYWAQAIQPGEATGLLLDNVTMEGQITDTWYYGIHATGEFVSAGEWKQDGSSYYMDQAAEKAITANAYALLDAAGKALDGNDTSWIDVLNAAPLAKDDAQGSLVTIAGKQYYKLGTRGSMAYIMSKDYVNVGEMDSSIWRDTNVRAYLNGDYYNSLPASLRAQIFESDIRTHDYNSMEMITTQDKVFLAVDGDLAGYYDDYGESFLGGSTIPQDLLKGKQTSLRPGGGNYYRGLIGDGYVWGDTASCSPWVNPIMYVSMVMPS